MLQLDFAQKLLALSYILKHLPLPDDYKKGKKKKKDENRRISESLLVVKVKANHSSLEDY